MTSIFDVAVVGGGMTGLVAAHHAALEGCSVLHYIGDGVPGGLVANVGDVEGYPATGPVSALELALRLTEDNRRLGIEAVPENVTRLETCSGGFELHVASGSHAVRAVVAASGAHLRMLDVPGVGRLLDKGISQCAWCNGSLHRDQDVVVVGGGDSALQEALHLAKFASQVTVVTHGENLRARRGLVDRAADCDRLSFRWETEIVDVLGGDRVEAVRLRDRAGGAVEDLPCSGLFVYIGLDANSAWLGDQVARDARGFVSTNDALETARAGVFAAGALRRGYRGRLTNAVGEATTAALSAARYCRDQI
jgi:thioredoxin reductase (NADPH)